jgi:hypothetical protein
MSQIEEIVKENSKDKINKEKVLIDFDLFKSIILNKTNYRIKETQTGIGNNITLIINGIEIDITNYTDW